MNERFMSLILCVGGSKKFGEYILDASGKNSSFQFNQHCICAELRGHRTILSCLRSPESEISQT